MSEHLNWDRDSGNSSLVGGCGLCIQSDSFFSHKGHQATETFNERTVYGIYGTNKAVTTWDMQLDNIFMR